MIYIYAIITLLFIVIIYLLVKKPKPNTIKNVELDKIEYFIKLLLHSGFNNGNIVIDLGSDKIFQFIKYETNNASGLKLYLNNFGIIDDIHDQISRFLQTQKEEYSFEENSNDIVMIDLYENINLAINISSFILNELYGIEGTKCQITIQNIDPIKKTRFNPD